MQRAVTSSSNIFRRYLCLGSAHEEAKYDQPDSEFSLEGQLLHRLFYRFPETEGDEAWEARASLTADQLDALTLAETITTEFVEAFKREAGIPEDAEHQLLHETDLHFYWKGSPLFPGHSDLIFNWPAYRARVVVDAKFGFMEVEHAAHNTQLASYGVQCQQRDPVERCGVLIVQPRNFGPRKSSAIYAAPDLAAAEKMLAKTVLDSEKPKAPLVAGEEQCHYCRAKVACPAYKAKYEAVQVMNPLAISTLTNDQLEGTFRAIRFAKKIDRDVTNEMRARIDAEKLTGWKLRNTGDVRECTDALGLFTSLASVLDDDAKAKFTVAKFDACRGVGWGKLTKLVQEASGLSEKKAEALIERVSGPFVLSTPKEKSVVEAK